MVIGLLQDELIPQQRQYTPILRRGVQILLGIIFINYAIFVIIIDNQEY